MIEVNEAALLGWVNQFIVPMIRIGAMMMVAPVFGARFVPTRIRLVLTVAITFVCAPALPVVADFDMFSIDGVLVVAHQLLIGVGMGLGFQMALASFIVAGELISIGMGLSYAQTVDPQSGASTPVIGQYLMLVATMIFLATDGHLVLIQMVVGSFELIPVGASSWSQNGLWTIITWGSYMFSTGFVIAIPVVTAITIANIGFGVVTKAAPQLNIFAVGLPVTLLIGILGLGLVLPHTLSLITDLIMQAFGMLYTALAESSHG